MELNKINKVYIIGIGGIGVSGLAKIFKWQGKDVSGSDIMASEITNDVEDENITVHIGQRSENVPEDADLYIYSSAVPESNAERQKIKELDKQDKEMTYFEAVGEFMKDYEYSIAISGTHGKTTTTAILGSILVEAGLDPTIIVGTKIKQLGSNARLGKNKKYFIIEACEHKEHMMDLSPNAVILTNIEEDHLDYYRDLEHIQMTFQNYINKIPADGLLVKNTDDSECKELGFDGKIVSYGIDKKADVMAKEIKKEEQIQKFKVGKGIYKLQVPGDFNIYNALAAIAMAKRLGIKDTAIKKAVANFTGTWRRFEKVGTYRGAVVISDYAHHPTAIAGLMKATKEFYPNRRLVVLFQPHQHSRTKKLFNDFVTCFKGADLLILDKIFDVVGREEEEDQDVTSLQLAKAIEGVGKYVFYADNFARIKELLREHLEKDDVLLVVGAGDIYKIPIELCSHSQ